MRVCRLLLSVTIFILVILVASDCVSAKRSVREQPGKKKRNAAVEENNYGEEDRSTNHHEKNHHVKNHDKSRSRKRRSVDEIYSDHSGPENTSRNAKWSKEGKESSKKSRSTGKLKDLRSEEKCHRCKEETLKNDNGDKLKRKSDSTTSLAQKKFRKSGSKEKNCQNSVENSSDSTDYSDGTNWNREKSVKHSPNSVDYNDNMIPKTSSSQYRSKMEDIKRKKNNRKNRDSISEEEEEDGESENKAQESKERKRMKEKLEKYVCKENERDKKKCNLWNNIKDANKDEERVNRKSENRLQCSKNQKCKKKSEKSGGESEQEIPFNSQREGKSAKHILEHQFDSLKISSKNSKESSYIDKTPESEEVEDEDEGKEDEKEIPRRNDWPKIN